MTKIGYNGIIGFHRVDFLITSPDNYRTNSTIETLPYNTQTVHEKVQCHLVAFNTD